jgi:acetyl esterase
VPARTEDLSGLPPAFVLVAENDPLRFEGLRYGEAMKEAGVAVLSKSYEGVAHSFLGEPPSSLKVGEALADISAWLKTL